MAYVIKWHDCGILCMILHSAHFSRFVTDGPFGIHMTVAYARVMWCCLVAVIVVHRTCSV